MRAQILVCLLLIATANAAVTAQSGPAAASTKRRNALVWKEIQQETITFSHSTPLLGMPQSTIITAPLQCSPNGTLFLEALMPPNYMTRSLVSVTKSGKVTPFSGGVSALGLTQVQEMGFFPRNSHVYYLLQGRKRDFDGSKTSPLETFIARYSKDGAVETATRLKISMYPDRFGALPSGRFVIAGVAPVNNTPDLVMLDSHGRRLFPLDLSASGLYSPTNLSKFYTRNHGPDAKNMSSITSVAQFVSYGDDLLLLQAGTNFPLILIGNGGILRTISLKLPADAIIESLVPSSDTGAIYARIVEDNVKPQVHFMAAFDADTGAPLREVATTSLPLESIACESDGKFFAFKLESSKKSGPGIWTLLASSQ